MHPEMGTVELPTGTPSSAACTPTRLWLAHPSAGSCLPLCQNQSHLEQHLLMAVSLIGHQENCSIGILQLACITTLKSALISQGLDAMARAIFFFYIFDFFSVIFTIKLNLRISFFLIFFLVFFKNQNNLYT